MQGLELTLTTGMRTEFWNRLLKEVFVLQKRLNVWFFTVFLPSNRYIIWYLYFTSACSLKVLSFNQNPAQDRERRKRRGELRWWEPHGGESGARLTLTSVRQKERKHYQNHDAKNIVEKAARAAGRLVPPRQRLSV